MAAPVEMNKTVMRPSSTSSARARMVLTVACDAIRTSTARAAHDADAPAHEGGGKRGHKPAGGEAGRQGHHDPGQKAGAIFKMGESGGSLGPLTG